MESSKDNEITRQPSEGVDKLIEGDALRHRLEDEPGSLGVDLDGTNPGSRHHEMDNEVTDNQS